MIQDFISYLNTLHNLTPAGANALAESQVNTVYFNEIYSEFSIVQHIHNLLTTDKNNIIIITGHAGDGKSTIAFDLIKRLDDNFQNHTFQQHEYSEKYNLNILKDMSELSLSERKKWLTQAFNENNNWLIVSNTGPLLTSITEYLKSIELTQDIESEIFKLLDKEINVSNQLESLKHLNLSINIKNKNLFIINIAKLDNIEVALSIFRKIIQHSAWDKLVQDYPQHAIIQNYSTIRNNLEHVIHSIRLLYLYLLNYEKRLTLRQMLAHFCASLTGGYQLDETPTQPIIFSDLFFGYQNNIPWEKAFKIPVINSLHHLNFAGYCSLEIEKMITNLENFKKVDPLLYKIINNFIQKDQDCQTHQFKAALRRLIFIYNLYPSNYTHAQAQFLGSPNIEKYSKWRLDNRKFTSEYTRHIKKMSLQALNLFFSGINEDKFLNITLKRADSSVFQISQIKICSFMEKEFIVDYCTNKQQPYLALKKDNEIRLELSLPLLDYIQNIIKGDITESLTPIYKTQLERFKLSLIEYSEIDSEDEITLVRTLASGEVQENIIKISLDSKQNKILNLED